MNEASSACALVFLLGLGGVIFSLTDHENEESALEEVDTLSGAGGGQFITVADGRGRLMMRSSRATSFGFSLLILSQVAISAAACSS